MPKAIIFDVSGVLYADDIGVVFDACADEFSLDREKVRAIERMYLKEWLLHEESENQMDAVMERECGIKKFSVTWLRHYLRIIKPNDELHALLPKLKERHTLAILSNVSHHRIVADRMLGAYDEFDADKVFLSCVLHMKKPDAAFYEYAQQHLSVAPEEIVYIDDVQRNVEPALRLGWQAFRFETNEQCLQELQRRGIEI